MKYARKHALHSTGRSTLFTLGPYVYAYTRASSYQSTSQRICHILVYNIEGLGYGWRLPECDAPYRRLRVAHDRHRPGRQFTEADRERSKLFQSVVKHPPPHTHTPGNMVS